MEQKTQGRRGGGGPILISVTSLPCDSDLRKAPADTKAPQRQAGSQGSGLSSIPQTFHLGPNLRTQDPGESAVLAGAL